MFGAALSPAGVPVPNVNGGPAVATTGTQNGAPVSSNVGGLTVNKNSPWLLAAVAVVGVLAVVMVLRR